MFQGVTLLALLTACVVFTQAQIICNPNEPCLKGSQCHPHKGVCVKDLEIIKDRPVVWLDETDDKCSRSSDDCSVFGLEYAGSHPRGRTETWCQEGAIIRCVPSKAQPLVTTDITDFKVITYNVFERAFWVTNDGQRERTCRIPGWIAENHPEVDVIGLQEVFMGGCFADQLSIRALFCHYGYCHFTATVDEEGFAQPGGIFLALRWPIYATDQLIYDNAAEGSADFFAAKGVSYAKVVKQVDGECRSYHIMTTHLQAGKKKASVRESQAGEWGRWISSKNIPKEEPVIMCGDLNADWYSKQEHLTAILSNIGGLIPEMVGPMNFTSDPRINDVKDGGNPGWIDWVVFRQNNLLPLNATQEALYPVAKELFPACWCKLCITLDPDYVWPDDQDCEATRNIRHLSDHFPVLGSFFFPE